MLDLSTRYALLTRLPLLQGISSRELIGWEETLRLDIDEFPPSSMPLIRQGDTCSCMLYLVEGELLREHRSPDGIYATRSSLQAPAIIEADRIFGLLPEDQGSRLKALWEEFNAYETPEARFAHTMDNFQPMLLNNANGGGDWKEHGIVRSQVEKRNEKTGTGSEQIWQYMQKILDKNVESGSLGKG